jgi:hypothetical protein
MIWMHAGCFFLHFIIKYAEIRPFLNIAETNIFDLSKTINQSAYFPKFLLAVKIFLYLGSISVAQLEIFEKYCVCGKYAPKGGIIVQTKKEVVILIDILLFYFSIVGLAIFLIFTRLFSFRTIKERSGFACNERYKIDFLYFVKDDIHWFLILVSQTFLFISVINVQYNASFLIYFIVRYLFFFAIIFYTYFSKKDIYENWRLK